MQRGELKLKAEIVIGQFLFIIQPNMQGIAFIFTKLFLEIIRPKPKKHHLHTQNASAIINVFYLESEYRSVIILTIQIQWF